MRVEDPEVFELTHAKVLALLRDGVLDGLRVDHPDGLADPAGYLERLAAAGASRVWVEKILHPGEQLRDWPVSGTVGYEFLNDVQGLFVDPAGEDALTALAAELTGEQRSFDGVALEAQLEQARGTFDRELQRLRRIHDPGELEQALARLPVYRTYVRDGVYGDADRAALAAAGRPQLFEGAPEEFVARFQQTSPPVTAKGIEDTAFYRYVRLLALNDVGGDPGRWGISVAEFHAANLERARRFPQSLLVTQTHDTKRSGDARARIGALSAIADAWAARVRRLYELTDELVVDGAPDRLERYFIFQTLVGVWPIEPQRLEGYVEKALREAKRNTNWVDQNHDWEQRATRFAVALLTHEAFVEEFEPFVAGVRACGRALGARPAAAEADGAGRARRLPGRRADRPLARRSRQPPAGRLGRAARGARRAAGRRAAVARDDEAASHLASARTARAASGGVLGGRGVHADRGRPGRRRVQPRRRRPRRRRRRRAAAPCRGGGQGGPAGGRVRRRGERAPPGAGGFDGAAGRRRAATGWRCSSASDGRSNRPAAIARAPYSRP